MRAKNVIFWIPPVSGANDPSTQNREGLTAAMAIRVAPVCAILLACLAAFGALMYPEDIMRQIFAFLFFEPLGTEECCLFLL